MTKHGSSLKLVHSIRLLTFVVNNEILTSKVSKIFANGELY